MKKELKDGAKVSAKMTSANTGEAKKDDFNQNLEKEKSKIREERDKFKLQEVDSFTKFIQELFNLEAPPTFKRDFTDPRWPRNEIGENMQVERAYFFAMKGPRKAFLGYRSLGDNEINGDGKIIIDRINLKADKKRVDDKIIMAKKWAAEQVGWRYFWIHEDEVYEDDEARKVFLERFEPLAKQPEYTFGKPKDFHITVGNERLKFY